MSHEALVLEPGDTMYVGVLAETGEYVEVRLANVNQQLMVTDAHGTRLLPVPAGYRVERDRDDWLASRGYPQD